MPRQADDIISDNSEVEAKKWKGHHILPPSNLAEHMYPQNQEGSNRWLMVLYLDR